MRDDTRQVFNTLTDIPEISSFLLVGGTALSILANHRVSEDLDFGTTQKTLPRQTVTGIIEKLKAQYEVTDATDFIKIQEAENEGNDLLNYHQDWLIGGVKVTFFTIGENDAERKEIASFNTLHYGYINMLDKDGIFFTKCMTLCDRIKSRDIFDLWWFVTAGDKDVVDIFNTIQRVRTHITYEKIRQRLLSWPIPKTDEGLESVINITIDRVREELAAKIDQLEIAMAREMASQLKPK